MRREEHPSCPKIERGQEELTSEQQASVRQFAYEQIAAKLSCKAIDEQEADRRGDGIQGIFDYLGIVEEIPSFLGTRGGINRRKK